MLIKEADMWWESRCVVEVLPHSYEKSHVENLLSNCWLLIVRKRFSAAGNSYNSNMSASDNDFYSVLENKKDSAGKTPKGYATSRLLFTESRNCNVALPTASCTIALLFSHRLWWVKFEFHRFKKVLSSVSQSEYRNTVHVKNKNLKLFSRFHQ